MKPKTTAFANSTVMAAVILSMCTPFQAHAVDSFDAASKLLLLDAVTLGGITYTQVQATVNAYTLLGVDGGTPVADTFDTATNLLTLGAVSFQGATYNNVRVRIASYALLSAGSTSGTGGVVYANMVGASLGAGASLNGAIPFPANNAWNADVSGAALDPNSDALIASIGLTRGLHPDFGSGLYEGAPIGIPYVVVASTQAKVPITFTDYGDESDPGPYPVPANAPIEGQQANGSAFGGDRHVLVVDRDANLLYEMGNSYPQGSGSWKTSGGAVFHLDPNTSANVPPTGMLVRLKASYVIPASFSTESKAILQSMKTYGMLVADNGSNWYVSGAPDPRWNNDKLVSELGSVKGSSFEVVRMDGLVTP